MLILSIMREPSCYVAKKAKVVVQYPSSAREIAAINLLQQKEIKLFFFLNPVSHVRRANGA